jgi:penicillin-binding protein 1C
MIQRFIKHKVKFLVAVSLLVAYYFSLPKQLFNDPTSTVIESTEGLLLGAKIASDGQWRFPQINEVPEKFMTCLIQFEDAYFYKHPGFNPVSIYKALKDNMQAGTIKRGGSTITQQVIRLSRKNPQRTYFEKVKELILATRLEFRHSKKEILALYASNAPFGGNVVGLDVAAWRYFGSFPEELSWAESATLAVLPNTPSLIFPGRNQERLLVKRNRLLKKLFEMELIDETTYKLSIAESLPQKPFGIPQIAPHLLQKVSKEYSGQRIQTSVQYYLQNSVNKVVKQHNAILSQNEIHNLAVLVLDIETRKVLSYVGNAPTTKEHQKDVDIIDKPRSTGSIMKPFLHASLLDAGAILPQTLIADVPTKIGNYEPRNFNEEFEGAVKADEALYRSLNVPAVRSLNEFGLDRFYHYLKLLKLKDIRFSANHYGLSLILGGAESNLWDLTKSYAGMVGTINHFNQSNGKYYTNEFQEPSFMKKGEPDFGTVSFERTIFDAGSNYLTFEALKNVKRPEMEENWEFYSNALDVSWKTGTSFGFRDAWAIGVTRKYVVGVWVGNADGEGRPGLTGVNTAAPVMFDVFKKLPQVEWLEAPLNAMESIEICSKSGYRAGQYCEETEDSLVQSSGLKTASCPFHFVVHTTKDQLYQVNSSCESVENMSHFSWFVLPPLMEYYFKQKNPFYKTLPEFKPNCMSIEQEKMAFISLEENEVISLVTDIDSKRNGLVIKIAHSNPKSKLFWYMNSTYIGTTKEFHEMEVFPKNPEVKITVLDQEGSTIERNFKIADGLFH